MTHWILSHDFHLLLSENMIWNEGRSKLSEDLWEKHLFLSLKYGFFTWYAFKPIEAEIQSNQLQGLNWCCYHHACRQDCIMNSSIGQRKMFHFIILISDILQTKWNFFPTQLLPRSYLKRKMSFTFTLYLFWCRLSESDSPGEEKFVCFRDLNEM